MASKGAMIKNIWRKIQKSEHNVKLSPENTGSTSEAKPHLIKIYGERNSGTHFVQQLIQRNFICQSIPGTLAEAAPGYRELIEEKLSSTVSDEAKRIWIRQATMDSYFQNNLWNTLGWKHANPPIEAILSRPDNDQILIVTVTKNPYAWILSLFRRPYEYLGVKKPDSIAEFISEPWPTVERDYCPTILSSPIELWNIKTEGYFRLSNKVTNVLCCRYEDILTDPHSFLKLVSNHLTRKNDEFKIHTDSAKEIDKGKKNLDFYKDYYLHKRWINEFSKQDLDLINRFLDTEVVRKAGYEIVEHQENNDGK